MHGEAASLKRSQIVMGASGPSALIPSLEKAKSTLQGMAVKMESEVTAASKLFQDLAGTTDSILSVAASIVGCVEDENVSSILPKVQTLGTATRGSIAERLQATTQILEAVGTGVKLLRQLSVLTVGQEAIAMETKALSVLTNVEAARLGTAGAGFQYLARELSDFSKALTEGTQEIATQTENRRDAIESTRSVLSAELPALRDKLGRVEVDLGKDLGLLDSRLTQLSSTPTNFRTSVEHTAQQIAGVVSAIQTHDISRQQIEHVFEALSLIVTKIMGIGTSGFEVEHEVSQLHAGLTIQIYQLRTIKDNVHSWTSQIRACLQGILNVSASEVIGIGPLVLQQEREVSSQLSHIETLERESQSYGARIQHTLGGLSNLMQLVNEHRERSKAARDRLRMLSFNSIIEARRLGANAGAILAIAKSIKEISADWSAIVDQSGQVMQQIQELEIRTNEVMKAFSKESNELLREAQSQTESGLGHLRDSAAFAAKQAQEMYDITGRMQAKSAGISSVGGRLESCFESVDTVLSEIECARQQLEANYPHMTERYDSVEIEKLFSASYTTEIERDVLHAAIRGAALPTAQQSLSGNAVELF